MMKKSTLVMLGYGLVISKIQMVVLLFIEISRVIFQRDSFKLGLNKTFLLGGFHNNIPVLIKL
jgi:hypothetical protein